MPVVTALRATRSGAVALHVDGEYCCTVSESLVARWHLFKGRELDAEAIAELQGSAARERTAGDAYRLLGHRPRSRAELRRRLLEKGHDERVVDDVLGRLEAEGFVDDHDFARRYAADKRRLAAWGDQRVRRELEALGVAGDIVSEVMGEAPDDDDELARAEAFLARRSPPAPPLDAARRRAYQALVRRGFAGSVAYAAVRRWAGDERPAAN